MTQDAMRESFEAWYKENRLVSVIEGVEPALFKAYQAAHQSREAEVQALKSALSDAVKTLKKINKQQEVYENQRCGECKYCLAIVDADDDTCRLCDSHAVIRQALTPAKEGDDK